MLKFGGYMSRQSLKAVSKLIDMANREVPVEEQFLSELKKSISLQNKSDGTLPSKTFLFTQVTMA